MLRGRKTLKVELNFCFVSGSIQNIMPSSQHSLCKATERCAEGQCILIHKVLWDQGESFSCSWVWGREWCTARAWITAFLQQERWEEQWEQLLGLKCAFWNTATSTVDFISFHPCRRKINFAKGMISRSN